MNHYDMQEMYTELYLNRLDAIITAEYAIEANSHDKYLSAEEQYQFADKLIQKYYSEEDSIMSRMYTKHQTFPEWPPAEQRRVFSDDEVEWLMAIRERKE